MDTDRSVLLHAGGQASWWTWAGGRGNAVLAAALDRVAPAFRDRDHGVANDHIVLNPQVTAPELRSALDEALSFFGIDLAGVEPEVDPKALQDLKFSDMLPADLAARTLGRRLADHAAAGQVAARGLVERRAAPTP